MLMRCDRRDSPPEGTMMDPGTEVVFKTVRWSGLEEISWWTMFQLLIPGMSERETASLRAEYCPCKLITILIFWQLPSCMNYIRLI